ncbi:MAG: helix-turn-helix domain-containing protein [Candidatus Doudnabacteria bacterium]|nr:helix-turn-helix domain-containing protein [Candidatus Doudnabacteria bacterium]
MIKLRDSEVLLSIKEATSFTPFTPAYLNLLVRTGKIRAVKLGRDWFITAPELFDYLKNNQAAADNKARQMTKHISKLKQYVG